VQSLWLAWILAASPEPVTLWLRADLGAQSPCHLASLAAAIHSQRPDARVAIGTRSLPSDLEAELTAHGSELWLTVRGQGKPLSRVLPPPGNDCVETVQTAALMIDRYLDELNESTEEARIGGLTGAPKARGILSLGPSVVQTPAGLSAGLTLEFDLRLGLLLLSVGGEVNLPRNEAATTTVTGTYKLQPAATWIAAGVGPRLGPGRLAAQASLGLSLLWVTIGPTTPPTYQQQQANTADPFLGFRLGYVLDLPANFNVSLRYEERWVPAPTTFSVEGYPGSGSVSVRAFSGDLALLVGYTIF
jgi:hypothetical protein